MYSIQAKIVFYVKVIEQSIQIIKLNWTFALYKGGI